MIYALHELRRAASAPLLYLAESGQQLFSSPFSPLRYTPGSERVAAGAELLARSVKHYDKPAWGINTTEVAGTVHAIQEQVVVADPFCKLVRFIRVDAPAAPRLLLVAPMSGHHATLLRDTVRMLIRDFDVYVTDWVDPRLVSMSHGQFHLDDYVTQVRDFIRLLGPEVHVMAVCQPTVPVLGAVALMAMDDEAQQPASMVLMGGPIDTRISPTAVNDFAKAHSLRWFELNLITRVPAKYPGFTRRVYPGFLQHSGFVAMNPDRHLQAHLDFYHHLIEGDGDSAAAHRSFYDEYNAVMDLDADFYLETLKSVFMGHELPQGRWRVHNRLVNPAAITRTALMTVEGEKDDICAPGQTIAAHELCANLPASEQDNLLVPKVGHYGIFSGRRWRESVYPRVRDFMLARSRQPD